MAFDLKPLSNDVIHKMGYTSHDLWVVKFEDEEVLGPFEVESLKHYATENEEQFQNALASRMDTNDWQPFYSHAHFQTIEHPRSEVQIVEKYWIMNQGQKAGPFVRRDIDKKFELSILSLTDIVSMDDGHTWVKFFALDDFSAQVPANSLPMAPLESSFQKAKEELHDLMDNQERTGSHIGLAALTYLGHHKDKKLSLNLEEIDLKSLSETEVSRSLKWAIPSAVAGLGVFILLGNFLLSPSVDTANVDQERPEKILPKTAYGRQNGDQPAIRNPASYPQTAYRPSGLTNAPPLNQNQYPTHTETHYNEPDPIQESEYNPPPEQQEHSLVNNGVHDGSTLDQVMSAGSGDVEAIPEQPVIEEASDF